MIEAHVSVSIPNGYLLHLILDDFALKKATLRLEDLLYLVLTDPQIWKKMMEVMTQKVQTNNLGKKRPVNGFQTAQEGLRKALPIRLSLCSLEKSKC